MSDADEELFLSEAEKLPGGVEAVALYREYGGTVEIKYASNVWDALLGGLDWLPHSPRVVYTPPGSIEIGNGDEH